MFRAMSIAALMYITFHYLQLMDLTLPVKYSFTVYAVSALYLFHFLMLLLIPNLFEKWINEVSITTILVTLSTFTLLVCTRLQWTLNGKMNKELLWSADAMLVLTASTLIPYLVFKLDNIRTKLQQEEVKEWNSLTEPPATIDHVDTKITHVETNIVNFSDRKPYSGAGTTFQE